MLSAFAQSPKVIKKHSEKRTKYEHLDKKKVERRTRVLSFNTKQKPVLKAANAEKQRLDYYISVNWNSEKGKWENSSKSEYTYDANGNITVYLYYDLNNFISQWENSYKSEYTYDTNGNPTVGIYSDWNSETSQWENSSKSEYTYDANGNPTVEIYSYWNSETSQWENSSKSEYTYDANGNPTVEIYSDWNSETSQWENSSKSEYTYDANGNPTVEIYSDWNSETSQWENSSKSEYTYDANGNPTVEIYSDWNSETSQWENSYKSEYTYDANGNPTVEIYSDWNSETSQWENSYKSEYTYDLTYSLSDLILPDLDWFAPDYSNLIANKPVDYISYDYIDGNWVNDRKRTYHYSTVNVSSVSSLSTEGYSIYPNPALDVLNFSFTSNIKVATFDLYDTHGRKLISKAITNKEQLNLEGLNSGIYLYHLNLDGLRQCGKLIKE
jgi:hypothetical protein